MGWESSDVVRFDLGPLLQVQMRVAKLKSAYNSCNFKKCCFSSGYILHLTTDASSVYLVLYLYSAQYVHVLQD